MRISELSLSCLLTLVACSKPATTPGSNAGAVGTTETPPISAQMSGVASSPLNDLNLVQAKIPPALLLAQKAPYAPPTDPGCDGLANEIRQLDAALGPDLDASAIHSESGLVERGRSEAGEAAVGALRHTAEGLIPFRGWVRKLSGAERYSKQVLEAITAGIVRRAYLKGLGQAQGCSAPAAPTRPSPSAVDPVPTIPVKEPDSR
jgi:hypothetical protein